MQVLVTETVARPVLHALGELPRLRVLHVCDASDLRRSDLVAMAAGGAGLWRLQSVVMGCFPPHLVADAQQMLLHLPAAAFHLHTCREVPQQPTF